jgi:hypothetical protein
MDILGTQRYREQLKKDVQKGANLIKLAEHEPSRRDVWVLFPCLFPRSVYCTADFWSQTLG